MKEDRVWLAGAAAAMAVVAINRWQGRLWWCACGGWSLWQGDIWSQHCSQHLLDPYSFSHVLHGVLFFWLFSWALKRAPAWQFPAALITEALWELLENSQLVIQRYREATIALGYEGDSVLNSMGDVLCCAAGFFLARKLGWKRSLAFLVAVELVLLFAIKDNLTLNVLMLLCPIDGIKAWQMAR